MNFAKPLHKPRLAALLMVLSMATAQAEEASLDAYVMTVYSNLSHGTKVIDGVSEDIVAKLARRTHGRTAGLADHVNLCVAYTKLQELEKAATECDSAIAASLREARRLERLDAFGRRTTMVADTGRAIALTNRGVLHAISGESEKARVMFEMAMLLDSEEHSASTNLTRLDSKTAVKES